MNRLRAPRQQEGEPAGPCAEIEDIQPIYPNDFVDRALDVSQIIFPRDQGFVPIPFRLIDFSLLFAHVHLSESILQSGHGQSRSWNSILQIDRRLRLNSPPEAHRKIRIHARLIPSSSERTLIW